MKKILLAMLCCVFAVSLAVTGCAQKGGKADGKKDAKAADAEKKEAPKPVNGVQVLAESMCKAGLAGDVKALLDLFPPQMFDAMKAQMAELGMEGDPREMFMEEMKGEAMLESCSVVSAEEKPCGKESSEGAKEMGIEKVEACGVLKIKSKAPDEEEATDDIPAIKVEGKWYFGDM